MLALNGYEKPYFITFVISTGLCQYLSVTTRALQNHVSLLTPELTRAKLEILTNLLICLNLTVRGRCNIQEFKIDLSS